MRSFNNDRDSFRNFNDRSFGGGNRGRSFSGGRSGFDRNRNDRQMFDAICDKCGQSCQVPFQPTGEKPVYCSNCFEKTSGRDGNGERSFGGGNRRYESRDTRDYQQDNTRSEIEAINKKLDRIIELLLNKNVNVIEKNVKEKKVKGKKLIVENKE